MPAAPDDPRRAGQELDLPPGTVMAFARYRARSVTSEHEHCLFCWAKFMDPDFSSAHRVFIDEHPEVLVDGYTTSADHQNGASGHWVCPQCVSDFADELGLQIEGGPGQGGVGHP